MGATKRIAELVLQAKSSEPGIGTQISMVRFGNVLGSSGSVVPKFKRQIEAGGPVTLTHPDVTRYFMTIPEAAQLVLQASSIAEGGDVFVLDMGEPVRIEDMAITMIKLMGRQPQRETGRDKDIEIVVEGLRPGEKMYEELFLSSSFELTVVKKIFVAKESWVESDTLASKLEQIKACSDKDELRDLVLDFAFMRNVIKDVSGMAALPAEEASLSSTQSRVLNEV
ncbi:MAG: polysaccharide biosynthesis protein, partial [Gammaproteobacteria bacterium]|nr:polysaccharide biosynthesis protein [Gammaproteobacteria bacterium]